MPDDARDLDRIILADDAASRPDYLTPDERARMAELAAGLVLNIPWCSWTPNPGPQSTFLLDFGRESLYGGAAGGGKSIALMMAASQFLHVPGYSALLIRKSYADLGKPQALMDIADQWWGPFRGRGVKFDAQQHTYFFDCPGGGRSRIVFGALDNENDRFNYQGGAYHFLGMDELTQQKERDYRYLISRIRRVMEGPLSRLPIRFRCTTNPGGTGHEWVYKRFIARWEAWLKGLAPRPRRNFWPALITDNPKLDRDDYIASLMELDPVTRAQLMRGDWNIRPDGRMFRSRWFKPINRADIPGNCHWVRFWDMASTDPMPGLDPDYTVGVLMGRAPDGRVFIADVRRWRKDPGDNDVLMRRVEAMDTRMVVQLMEQEPGSAGKTAIYHYRTQVFRHSQFYGVPARNKGQGRTTTLTGRKTPPAKILAAGPYASMASADMVYVVVDGSWDHDAFIGEHEIFPDGDHDDQVDAAAGAYAWLQKYGMGTPGFGSNAEYEQENQWRPEAIRNDQLEQWLGGNRAPEIVTIGAERAAAEIEAATRGAWGM